MNIPEIAKCPWCDKIPQFETLDGPVGEQYMTVRHPDNRCILAHMVFAPDDWNRRQPTPEAADNEPDFDLWTRIAFYAIKAAEKQNGIRLIPMGDEDAEAFMESIDCALQESLDEILETDSDEPAHPPKPEPTEAHSKSEFKRLSVLGANVVPPKPTKAMLDITDLMATDVRRASAPKPPAEWMALASQEIDDCLTGDGGLYYEGHHCEAADEREGAIAAIIAKHYSAPAGTEAAAPK